MILITNDDGIHSKGLRTLVETAKKYDTVKVIAPDRPQSGMGHAVTIGRILRIDADHRFGDDVEAYRCSGTPVDCVKLAHYHLFKGKLPDLVLSGINHGSNLSVNVLYSGTMSAAVEGSLEKIPSIGFSLCDYDPDADFSHAVPHIRTIIEQTMEKGFRKGVSLNVNIPKSEKTIKGIRFCKQAQARWQESFVERKDPQGQAYFWLTGEFISFEPEPNDDTDSLNQGYITVVPCQYDLTDYDEVRRLNGLWEL